MHILGTFWPSYGVGVFSGFTVASLTGLAVWLYNYCRNKRLENRLREAIAPKGIWSGLTGAGVTVENKTEASVIVRSVMLMCPRGDSIRLDYFGPGQGVPSSPRFGGKADGGSLSHGAALERGFIELPPHCGGLWGLSTNALKTPFIADKEPIDCKVVIEYPTLIGSRRLIAISGAALMEGGGFGSFLRAASKGHT